MQIKVRELSYSAVRWDCLPSSPLSRRSSSTKRSIVLHHHNYTVEQKVLASMTDALDQGWETTWSHEADYPKLHLPTIMRWWEQACWGWLCYWVSHGSHSSTANPLPKAWHGGFQAQQIGSGGHTADPCRKQAWSQVLLGLAFLL